MNNTVFSLKYAELRTDRSNSKWATDSSCIQTKQGVLYLSPRGGHRDQCPAAVRSDTKSR